MAGNTLRFATELDDKVSKKLTGISRAFDKLGGPGSGASLFGNVGANAVARGFDLIGNAAEFAIGFVNDSIDAASKLEQATGAVESVFGTAAQTIKDFGSTAATATGQAKSEVNEAAAVIGAKLTGMGFTQDEAASKFIEIDQRAADMAATFGGPTSDAIAAISSALTGERDPIERYGVSIKEADVQAKILALGLDTSTTAAKKNATAVATLAIIMDSTKASAGQFAAQTGTLAEKQQISNAKMENARAVLGDKLQPLFESFSQFMIDTGIPALEGLVGVLVKVAGVLGTIIDLASKAFDAIQKVTSLGQDTKGAFDQGLSKYGLPAPGDVGNHAAGGWVGLNGPELSWVGERGPEYIVPNHELGGMGVRLQGVSERELADIVDRRLLVRLQRAGSGQTAG